MVSSGGAAGTPGLLDVTSPRRSAAPLRLGRSCRALRLRDDDSSVERDPCVRICSRIDDFAVAVTERAGLSARANRSFAIVDASAVRAVGAFWAVQILARGLDAKSRFGADRCRRAGAAAASTARAAHAGLTHLPVATDEGGAGIHAPARATLLVEGADDVSAGVDALPGQTELPGWAIEGQTLGVHAIAVLAAHLMERTRELSGVASLDAGAAIAELIFGTQITVVDGAVAVVVERVATLVTGSL